MGAAWLTTVVATMIGVGAVAGYLEITDPGHASASENAVDLLRALGLGLLAGALSGLVTSLLAAWGAMALRAQLYSGRRRARLIALGCCAVLWAVGVALVLHVIGFGGLGALAYAISLPALAVALVMTWLLVPWVVREPDADRRPKGARTR